MSQVSSSVGTQRGSDSELSKDKLKIQNIVETLCPRLCQAKAILQDYMPVGSHTGSLLQKMTQALAEQAVEVTSNISHLLEGAEETSQHLDDILQLEQTLRDIYVFVQSETQRNLLLRLLFAKDLRVRYFSLDKQLRGLQKPFEQTVKKPLALCATIQEDHPDMASHEDGALAEIVSPNNNSAIHASGSFFHHANNTVVRDGSFYAAHNLVVKQVQSTPQGIVEGAEVFTFGDVLPKKEIYKGRGYRVYSGTAKAKAVKIKLYEGSCAKNRCLAAARFSQKVMHPNVLHLIGVSPLNSELPFLVFDESSEWAIESIIASALSKGLTQSLFLGLQTVAGLSSGLDYLRTLLFPFASVGLDHFVVTSSHDGNILISFDPEILPDEAHERDQHSGASDSGNELDIFHGLCQKTFDAACKAHYEFQKVQRGVVDELDADHDLDQDRFEELEVDAETPLVHTEGPISEVFSPASPAPQRHATSLSAPRRELVWKSHKNEVVSLEEIARQFQSFLLTSSRELEFNRRRGRYTSKTAHRCPGYSRIEITLTPDIARSAIVSHLTPTPHEICPVCKEIVKEAEIFACICGREDNESIPTIRCSTCSEWHHRPCVSISENEDQSFVCRRCKVQSLQAEPKPNERDLFGHFYDAEGAHGRYAQTEEMSLPLTPTPTAPQPPQSSTPSILKKSTSKMSGKHVHFTSDTFPDTPLSSMSLPSSGGPRTPVSAPGSSIAGHVPSRIHALLATTQPSPMLKYDVSQPPSTINPNVSFVRPHALNEPATSPPIPFVVIHCPDLPWTITILPSNTEHVTVGDVIDGIYRSLRLAVVEDEYLCLPSAARNSVNNAYTRRYKRLDDPLASDLEKTKGLKRVDFLGERTQFTGLKSTKEGPHLWCLSMS